MTNNGETTRKAKSVKHPRSPRVVMEDLIEVERMIKELRARYSHAYDLAYSLGGGAMAAGGSRTDIKYSRPTEDAALAESKDRTRSQVERAGRAVNRMVDAAHQAHSALVEAMPGADPYEQAWKASDEDAIATRAERAETALKQAQRLAGGDL
jgi:hypothetical protein